MNVLAEKQLELFNPSLSDEGREAKERIFRSLI